MWRKRSVTISTTRSHRKQPRRTVPSSREPIPLSYARFVTDRSSRSFSLPLCPFLSISPILAPVVVGCYYIVLNSFFPSVLSLSRKQSTCFSSHCFFIGRWLHPPRGLIRLNSKRPVKRQRRVFCVVWNTCSTECCASWGQRPVYAVNTHKHTHAECQYNYAPPTDGAESLSLSLSLSLPLFLSRSLSFLQHLPFLPSPPRAGKPILDYIA